LEEEIDALQEKKNAYVSTLVGTHLSRPKGIKCSEFRAEVDEMIWKQKRALLQQFVNFDKDHGIRVFAKDKIEVYISIKSLGLIANRVKSVTARPKKRGLRCAAFCVHQWICGGR
jgi:hypothetical protein